MQSSPHCKAGSCPLDLIAELPNCQPPTSIWGKSLVFFYGKSAILVKATVNWILLFSVIQDASVTQATSGIESIEEFNPFSATAMVKRGSLFR